MRKGGECDFPAPCAEEPGYRIAGLAARSRWRWTIVVVRQFSLRATSRIHPPAGIRWGLLLAAGCNSSCSGYPERRGSVVRAVLLVVVMA